MKIRNDYELEQFYIELDYVKFDLKSLLPEEKKRKDQLLLLKDDISSAIIDYEATKKN